VYDHLRAGGVGAVELRCVAPVGRLDADSEGLMLMTNDGTLAQCLLAPGGVEKRYLAAVSPRGARGASRPQLLQRFAESGALMQRGVPLPGGTRGHAVRAAAVSALDEAGGSAFADLADAAEQLVVEVCMVQGARREVRRLLKAVGWRTERLCRVAIGPLSLCRGTYRELKAGEWRALSKAEIRSLYRCVAPQLDGLAAYDSGIHRWVPASEMVRRGCDVT
jgi:23S rRNA pseudouridine2605 synthase